MTRRWSADTEFELDGLRWRVVVGRKAPGDLRLEHMTPNGWRPTAMALVFMLTDFWYENEDLLYPKPRYQGADYLLKAIRRAALNGYESEVERLEGEKTRKREKERAAKAQPTLVAAPVLSAPSVPPPRCVLADCDNDPEWHCAACGRHLESVYVSCPDHPGVAA